MFWQIVTFTFEDGHEDQRRRFEDALAALPSQIPSLQGARVGRAADDTTTTGYVCGFVDDASFQAYLRDPAHTPLADAAQALCSRIDRLLMETGDDPMLLVDSPKD